MLKRLPGGHSIVAVAIAAACLLAATPALAARPSFKPKTATMRPGFQWHARDYGLRGCGADGAKLKIRGRKGWLTAVGSRDPRPGSYGVKLGEQAGEGVTVSFRKRRHKSVRRYHLRCLPDDFPEYRFRRERDGGPRLFAIQMINRYGAIFDRNGAPLWWLQADGEPNNMGVLEDGTIAFSPVDQQALQVGDLEVRTLRNKLLHRFPGAPGTVADVHDLRLLPNGNYMIGAQVTYQDDTTAYGGTANSDVIGIEIQEFDPDGNEVYSWASKGHIGLEETGRWWDTQSLDNEPYDVVHWNSVEDDGRYMLISMRHTDAVYKVDKQTGDIVWKLGGTPTPESLEVVDDPHGDYPLGGQHDARLQPNGTVTIHDNRTGLGDDPPRAVRYRINEGKGRAKLVESVTDPDLTGSICCGSARRLGSGDWLLDWGGNGITAAYDDRGRRLYKLTLGEGFSYRSNPVPKGAVKRKQLRNAMDSMAGGG